MPGAGREMILAASGWKPGMLLISYKVQDSPHKDNLRRCRGPDSHWDMQITPEFKIVKAQRTQKEI